MKPTLNWQIASITGIKPETASVKTFTLKLPSWMRHRAGQHYDIRLTAEDGYQTQRSYSIASEPEPVAAPAAAPFSRFAMPAKLVRSLRLRVLLAVLFVLSADGRWLASGRYDGTLGLYALARDGSGEQFVVPR